MHVDGDAEEGVLHHIALLNVGALIQQVLDAGQVPCQHVGGWLPEFTIMGQSKVSAVQWW